VRPLLPLALLALACAGCSSPEKKAARQARQEQIVNTRAIEERRLRAVDGREIASPRAAEIFVADPQKTFDPQRTPGFGSRGFNSKGSRVKEFQFAQRTQTGAFRTRDFPGSRTASMSAKGYATMPARTQSYGGPKASQAYDTKAAPTRTAREADRTMATRELPGSQRAYLGPEAGKMKTALDPNATPKVSNDLRELKTIEDIRTLLNKNE